MGIITSRSPLTFHMAFQLLSSSKLIVRSLCHSILKKYPGTKDFQSENTLSASLVLYFITSSVDFACLWRGADSSSNKQQKQTSKWQSANEGESVLLCCIDSQLLIRLWDFLRLHGNKRLILQQRLPCNVGRLIMAEKELALHSPGDGRIRGYREGDLGAEAVLTNLSCELMKRYRAASTVAFGSKLLF